MSAEKLIGSWVAIGFPSSAYNCISADEGFYSMADAKKEFKYNETTKLIYNGRRDFVSGIPAIVNYENGTLRTIDNNEDDVYDIIYIFISLNSVRLQNYKGCI